MKYAPSQKQRDKFKAYMVKMLPDIAQVLPKHLTPERITKLAAVAASKNYAIYDCSFASIAKAIITASQLGLEPDGTLGQAYIIPYDKEAQLIIGYKGMIDLALRSGKVKSIEARLVYEHDSFECRYGLDADIKHSFTLDTIDGRGEIVGCYAVATLSDGSKQFEVLTMQDILAAKGSSKARNSESPWNKHFGEMAKKTAVRKLCKYLPVGVEFERVAAADSAADYGDPTSFDIYDIDISDAIDEADESILDVETPTKKSTADKIMAKLDQKEAVTNE